ncbi:MAG: hypothetical protein KDE08_16230 [Rhodobacteraceae bacterium]|nr:hypothetical protein [Paracoccaceae bacterium]
MPVTPNMTSLAGTKGKALTCAIQAMSPPAGSGNCLEQSVRAEIDAAGAVTIRAAASGTGVWVPYMPGRTFYGWSTNGATWMGTGPFSGCHIAFFTDGARVGMAHIAKESGTSAAGEAWATFTKSGGITVLNEWKIGLPDPTRYSASYVFLDLSASKSIGLAQVDVHVKTMGGADGTIFDVKKVL